MPETRPPADAGLPETGHVLLIDDDSGVRRAMTATLRGMGWTVTEAASGPEGLARLVPDEVDVVLLDVMMPEVDGLSVCRQLATDAETAHLPVILLTALDGREDRLRGLEAGALEFLTKPVGRLELQARLRSALRLRHAHRQLASALRMQRRMVRMLVHDFRSPLSVIVANAELCQGGLPPELMAEALTDVAEAGRTAVRMVDEVVTLARFEGGQLRVSRQPLKLIALLERVLAPRRRLAPERGLRVQADEVPACMRLDPLVTERVFDNLVANALKYSPADSPVSVRVAQRAGRVRVEILDRGVGLTGIDPEVLFRPGVVGPGRLLARQGGLGLAFCRMAVEAHGGRVGLAPRDGGGTCAWVEFPVTEGGGGGRDQGPDC